MSLESLLHKLSNFKEKHKTLSYNGISCIVGLATFMPTYLAVKHLDLQRFVGGTDITNYFANPEAIAMSIAGTVVGLANEVFIIAPAAYKMGIYSPDKENRLSGFAKRYAAFLALKKGMNTGVAIVMTSAVISFNGITADLPSGVALFAGPKTPIGWLTKIPETYFYNRIMNRDKRPFSEYAGVAAQQAAQAYHLVAEKLSAGIAQLNQKAVSQTVELAIATAGLSITLNAQ